MQTYCFVRFKINEKLPINYNRNEVLIMLLMLLQCNFISANNQRKICKKTCFYNRVILSEVNKDY